MHSDNTPNIGAGAPRPIAPHCPPTDRVRRPGTTGALRPIALVGLSGCGKTTVGPLLAQQIALPFIDCDHEIERAAQMSVSALFETHGEADFRIRERAVIAHVLSGERCVLATGGGAFAESETAAMLRADAMTIWLDASVDVLEPRLHADTTRPLLHGADLRARLQALIARRAAFYRLADVHIRCDDQSPQAICVQIAGHIRRLDAAAP